MRQVRTLGLLGTGVIGGGWAARALHFGIDVVAADVKPEMEEWIRGAVANAEPALARLTFAPLPPKGKLSFTTDLNAMARQVDFIQENIPEQLELKQRVLADVSRHAPADVIIASSTSGLMPTDLQRDMLAPERFLVAHPFNPVYLLPLVELVRRRADRRRDARGRRRLLHLHRHAPAARCAARCPDISPTGCRRRIWREILHMVNEGRRHHRRAGRLDHLRPGPALGGDGHEPHLSPGRRRDRHAAHAQAIRPVPEVAVDQARGAGADRSTDRQMVEGTQAQAAGRSIRELERLRDDYLVAIQQVLRQFNIGAGATLRALEERLYQQTPRRGPRGADRRRRRCRPGRCGCLTPVRPEWVDYNGHMTDSRYLQVFGDATDALFRRAGVDDAYRKSGRVLYTVESHVTHRGEAQAGEPLYVTTQILAARRQARAVFHALYRARRCADRERRADVPARRQRRRQGGRRWTRRCAPSSSLRAAHAELPVRPSGDSRWAAGGQAAVPKIVDHAAAPRRDRARRLSGGGAITASSRPPSCASRARPATPPAWSPIITTPSRTSFSRRCG